MKRPAWPPDLSSGQIRSLETYEALLLERGSALGLMSPRDLARLRDRHILDCLRVRRVFLQGDRMACDLGSGAGLPGLVLAIALPVARFVLAEARGKRAGFLELAIERLGLSNAEVFAGRAEDLTISADVVTARAFGSLRTAWRVGAPLLRSGGRLVYFAGRADSATVGRSLTTPERPSSVETTERLANESPLVIMARG